MTTLMWRLHLLMIALILVDTEAHSAARQWTRHVCTCLCIVNIHIWVWGFCQRSCSTVHSSVSRGITSTELTWLIVIPVHSLMQTPFSSLFCLMHLPIFLLLAPSPALSCLPSPLLQTHSTMAGTLVARLRAVPHVHRLLSDFCLTPKQQHRLNA